MMQQNTAEDRIRLRRVLPERAIALAMENRWSEAADVNRKIIELYPNDADAYNRLGKALLEMGRYRDALATYQRAVELDPNNVIARKNVERLAHLAEKAPEPAAEPAVTAPRERGPARINPTMFIEETGKTGVTTLIVLTALLFLGGQVMYGFSMALIFGVLIGPLSSIYVASAAVMALGVSKQDLMPVKKEDVTDSMP